MAIAATRARVSYGLGSTRARRWVAAAGAVLLGLGATSSPRAMTIIPIYDSSITSRGNAAAIEAAFGAVASEFDHAYARNVTVKIGVSWGKVNGASLPSGDIGASRMPLATGYTYADMVGIFRADAAANPTDTNMAILAARLPAKSPAGSLYYDMPYAEAQAVGVLPDKIAADSGYVGFSSSVAWDYSPSNGISPGTYDFEGVAAHEISEVLGRITGLHTGNPTYATPIDALRYSAPGVSSFSYSQSAYFSINGGRTNLGAFNASGGGDRTDWRAITGDAQNAYFLTGVDYALSTADKTLLDVLGWGAAAPSVTIGSVTPGGALMVSSAGMAVPEPAMWTLVLAGFGGVGVAMRSHRRPAAASDARLSGARRRGLDHA